MKMNASHSIASFTPKGIENREFRRVQKLLYDYCGIFINEGKEALVQSRLLKRMRKLGIMEYSQYLDFIVSEPSKAEFLSFVDVLTTNKTSFFRESKHFDFIKTQIFSELKGKQVKLWSAGCSSGEEAISSAITLLEGKQVAQYSTAKILATDISRDVLKVAKQGIYSKDRIGDMPVELVKKYFKQVGREDYQIADPVRNMITYGRLNLTSPWPMKGKFQIIMCRNVMIYFNRDTQEEIVSNFRNYLEPGGYLFIGHSESINANKLGFRNVAPAAYQKI